MGQDAHGNPYTPNVLEGNLMVSRMVLLFLIIYAIGCSWILEQPASSLMKFHDRMIWYRDKVKTYGAQTWMGAFGAETPKSTDLLSSERSVLRLGRSLSRKRKFEDMGVTTIGADGSVTGGSGLKLTQEYTFAYAMEVFERFRSAPPNPQLLDDWDSDDDTDYDGYDAEVEEWEDAGLTEVATWLHLPTDQLAARYVTV